MTYTPTTKPVTYVNAWVWFTAPGAKSCAACVAQEANGVFYLPLNQTPNPRPPLHKNCTCTLNFIGQVIDPKG